MSTHQTSIQMAAASLPQARQSALATAIFAVSALVIVGTLVAGKAALSTDGDNLVTHCERLSNVVGRNLVEQGIAADTADWRRRKQQAFRACIDDHAAFEHLISAD